MNLHASTAFITGASGFIGCRIAERLWLDYGIAAECFVRSSRNAVRLARLPAVIRPGDILDRDCLEKAIGDSRIVFHCAYGNTADPGLNRRINEDGLRNLGEIAIRRGVERFVHISTVSVYGPAAPDLVTEETPARFSGDEYGDSKLRAEEICRDLQAQGLPVAVVRPTVVFGPFSPIWTVGAIKRVLAGGWENTGSVTGLCNPVYIDDLVDGIFLCIENDAAVGETFILSGEGPISWNGYFQAYKDAAGLSTTGKPEGAAPAWRRTVGRALGAQVEWLRKFMEPQLVEFYERLKVHNPLLARRLYAFMKGGLQENEIEKFSRKTVFSIEKARKMLGYAPRPFDEAMRETVEWLRYYEYI